MPTKDRKYYISKHNHEVDEENEAYKRQHGGGTTDMIDKFTDMDQESLLNTQNR